MASAKEIKRRMESVKETRKITNAMYLISQTKMRKAKEELEHTRPYFAMQEHEIKRIFRSGGSIRSHYFHPEKGPREGTKFAYLVITADKGLAGAYNMNVIRKAEDELKKHPDSQLYVVGEFGRRYFERHGVEIVRSFLYTAQSPTFRRAREICAILLEEYDEHRVDEIRVVYSDMENEMSSAVKVMHLLPLDRRPFEQQEEMNTNDEHYRFWPSQTEVLNSIIPSYVAGFIYGALVDSFSVEQRSRMTAMKSSTDNADELIRKLGIQHNRLRQGAITQELTEIASGARASKMNEEL